MSGDHLRKGAEILDEAHPGWRDKMKYVTIRVVWDVDPDDDDDPPHPIVNISQHIWETYQGPISEWLANKYGYLVKDWHMERG